MIRKIFIISSENGIKYAETLKALLTEQLYDCKIECWNDIGVFAPTGITIDSLNLKMGELLKCNGYVLALLTPDDKIVNNICQEEDFKIVARDNVIFELGMAFGLLGREHSIILKPNDEYFHMLSDISGVTYVKYSYAPQNGFDDNSYNILIKRALNDNVLDKIILHIDKSKVPSNVT